jgi:hypothetical protein
MENLYKILHSLKVDLGLFFRYVRLLRFLCIDFCFSIIVGRVEIFMTLIAVVNRFIVAYLDKIITLKEKHKFGIGR